MIPPVDAFARIGVALLIGLLIGLDRERAEARKQRRVFAGIRTFPLIALAGAISVLLIDLAGPSVVATTFFALTVLTVIAYYRSSGSGSVGATTETAAIVTFLLGALAGAGQLQLAGGVGIAVAVLLVAKPRLEGFSRALSDEEVSATLELAVISCIVLPLLPNQGYGPWAVLNPFDIWLVVVLVSAVSFAGFIAMRLLGDQKGLVIAGVVGGFVSSTAVTVAMGNRSREYPALWRSAAVATVLASVVMCLRVAMFAIVAGPGILARVAAVIVAMAVTGTVAAWLLMRTHAAPAPSASQTSIANPFSLWAALTFAALYALVLLLVQAAQTYFGSAGSYLAAGLSSLIDVDAVTIAFARAGPSLSGWREPAAAVSLALVVNTLVKLGIAVASGAGEFRRHVAVCLSLMAAAGAATGVVVYLRFPA